MASVTHNTPSPLAVTQVSTVPEEALEAAPRCDGEGHHEGPLPGDGSACDEAAALSCTSFTDEDSQSSSSDSKEGVLETSSDKEEEECGKRPRLDQDLVTDWYGGRPFTKRDQRQCDEYFLRGRSLIRCFTYLQEGCDLSSRHSHRLCRTLYAGRHSAIDYRNKNNSDYVKRARKEYEALLGVLQRRDGAVMTHYLLAALVTVHKFHMLSLQVTLMEVTLLLLEEEKTGVEDMQTLVDLCQPLEYSDLRRFLLRPAGEVMVGVVHSLLYRMTTQDLHFTLHRHHKCIYQRACAPVFGLLGYRGAPSRTDTAILYNNSAKIFHDYLGEEAHLLLLAALHANLLSPKLGQLSDLLLDRVARAARIIPVPPIMLRRLERHMHGTDSRPGPRGCVAILRLLRRCPRQLDQLQDLPALLQRLITLLTAHSDRPLTAARDLGRLLFVLRKECPALLQGTVQAGKVAITERLGGGSSKPEAAAQHFLVSLARLVVVAARAASLPPCSASDWESERSFKDCDEQDIRAPGEEEVLATLLGLSGRLPDPRASWSSLAYEVSHLVVGEHSDPQDCCVMDAVLQLATWLEDDGDQTGACDHLSDHGHPDDDHTGDSSQAKHHHQAAAANYTSAPGHCHKDPARHLHA